MWKNIPWYEWLYQTNKMWDIKSFYSWKILKADNNQWYSKIVLWKNKKWKTFTSHKIIMLTFVWPRPDNMEINHINKNKTDNSLKNLEYITHIENEKHKVNFKWFICPSVAKRKQVSQFTREWKYLRSYISWREAERITKINCSHIFKCCLWRKWYHNIWWYHWEYKKSNENHYIWEHKKKKEKRQSRKVFLQINKDWVILNEYNWRKDLIKNWFIWTSISTAIKKETLYKGYYWKTKKELN